MRVAVFANLNQYRYRTGDWMQALKTAESLRGMGAQAELFVFSGNDIFTIVESELVKRYWNVGEFDVLHFFPAPFHRPDWLNDVMAEKERPLLVCSTIFWDSLSHRRVIARNTGSKTLVLRYLVGRVLGIRSKRFLGYDLLLPNSDLEIENVRRHVVVGDDALLQPIPNGSDAHLAFQKVGAPSNEFGRDYVVYPGAFAHRKNQLWFIRAVKSLEYKVVFMGGPLKSAASAEYYRRCLAEAGPNMHFVGRLEHNSKRFLSILSNARVACLASSCETPGIALLEAAAMGVRPAVTREGSTREYFGFDASYFSSLSEFEIRSAIRFAWRRGRLSAEEILRYRGEFLWATVARKTFEAYSYAKEVAANGNR